MDKYSIKKDLTVGMHLYFNIKNFSDLLEQDTTKSNAVLLFQAIDLLIRQTQKDIKTYDDNVYIEKVTDSRIHCVIEECNNLPRYFYLLISSFFKNIEIINRRINGFKQLDDFIINAGCDYGKYVDYTLTFASLDEDNSIGFPCNKAAKIQNVADNNEILISKKAFDRLNGSKPAIPFSQINKERHLLEGTTYEDTFYSIANPDWESLDVENELFNKQNAYREFEDQVESLNRQTDKQISDFKTKIKKEENSPVLYCDIRGFTKKFEEDGSNLIYMVKKTVLALERMYYTSSKNMKHIQFQGDRELCSGDEGTIGKSIVTALELIDSFKGNINRLLENTGFNADDFAVGIGVAYGSYYRANIGFGDAKSPLLLGAIPMFANIAEDKYASKPYQISLHKTAYNAATKDKTKPLAKTVEELFVKTSNSDYYVIKPNISLAVYKDVYNKYYNETNSLRQQSDGGKPWSR